MEDFLMTEKPTFKELEQSVKELEKETAELEREVRSREVDEDRKRLDEELKLKYAELEEIFKAIPDAVVFADLNRNITKINSGFTRLFGYEPKEIYGKKTKILYTKEEEFKKQGETRYNPDAREMYHPYEIDYRKKNGDIFHSETVGTPVRNEKGEAIGLLAIVRDISDREQAEEALRESEEHFHLAFENANEGVCLVDTDGNLVRVNNRMCDIFGYSKKELESMTVNDFAHPEDKDISPKFIKKSISGEVESAVFEKRYFHKQGHIICGQVSSSIIKDTKGDSLYFISHVQDITQRKQAEEALRESEKRLNTILDSIQTGIVVIDAETHEIVDANPAAATLIGAPKDEIIGHVCHKYICPAEKGACPITDLGQKMDNSERILIKANGEEVPILKTVTPILLGGKECLLDSFVDLTEQKKMEAQLQRSQKMESMGLLAGGVAHDLNNVLSGIVSYPELLLLDLPEDSKFRKPIETMQESGHRAADIVQDLLTVARGVTTTKEPLNLNDTVSDYLNSPEFKTLEQFHPAVTVKTNRDTDLLNIGGSHVHIRKVVMNLVSNASEAIEGSGNVTISTVNRYIDRPLRGYDNVNIGEYAVLAVSDDGSGISSGDLERIFEPFYTKKVMGRSGTGLGLAVVWNVVQDHKGYIDVTTDENGTTFELYFPVTRDEISCKDLSTPIKDYKGNGETILVVDDVENQREISCKMLDTLGYKTKAASSGEEAVEYLKEHTVDLILLDMIMDPGINGCETCKRVIKIHPNQKVIIVSGFAETDDVKEAQKLGASRYIKKPLMLEKIGLSVKEELEK